MRQGALSNQPQHRTTPQRPVISRNFTHNLNSPLATTASHCSKPEVLQHPPTCTTNSHPHTNATETSTETSTITFRVYPTVVGPTV